MTWNIDLTSGGAGGGILYPDSAARPFSSNSARNTWANNNKQDLIKDTTVVNVGGSQWYLWTGESNPQTVQTSLWMDANLIVQGEKGDQGDAGVSVTNAQIDANDDLIITLSDGTTINAGKAKGRHIQDVQIDANGDLIVTLDDGSTINAGQISGFDPSQGFELNTGTRSIGLNNEGSLTVRDTATTEHTAIDIDSNDDLRLGSPTLPLVLRSSDSDIKVEAGGQSHTLAYMSDLPFGDELVKFDAATGDIVGTGIYSTKDGSAVFGSGSIDIGTHTISSAGEGIESTNDATGESYSFVFAGQGDDTGPVHRVIQPTRIDVETTTDKSKQLTNHISRVTAFDDFRLIREPITIEAVSAQTNVTMQVRSLNGEDIWSFGPFNMQAGVNLITPDTILDFKIGQYDVEFTSPDGDVVMVGGISPVTGLDIFYGILPTKLYTDETLANIKHGTDIVRTVEAGSNVTLTTDADGKLTISSSGGGSGGGGSTLSVNGQDTEVLLTDQTIASTYDAGTKTTELSVDVDQLDLSDYAALDASNIFTQQQIIAVSNGVVFSLRTTPTGSDEIKFWSSGAIELPNYTNFKDKELITKEYADEVAAYKGEGLAVQSEVTVTATTQTQTQPVTRFVHGWANSSPTSVTIDDTLMVAAESIVYLPADAGPGGVTYTVTFGTNSAAKNVRRGETWKAASNSVGVSWERVDQGLEVVKGLFDRSVEVTEPAVKLFQYADGMPYHLLIETPGTATEAATARLVHEFPRNKTFVFSPNATARTYVADIVVNESAQDVATADLALGEYGDLPLYVMEPNVVINRDQRASVSYPANMTIDISNGFYIFGTMSGWCGNNRTNGTSNVYIGTSDNSRTPFGCIGLRIDADGLYIMDGTATATQGEGSYDQVKFQRDDGLTNFYRFAFFVDSAGLMTYYVVSLNNGTLSSGTRQCQLTNVGTNPKLFQTYDRLGNNTSAIAIGETHLVLNQSQANAESLWNWRF